MNILFFDGHCHLCAGAVKWLLRRGVSKDLLFAPLQGTTFAELQKQYTSPTALPDSLVLFRDGKWLFKSEAALMLAGFLPGQWRWLRLLRWFPESLRNWVYDRVARNRYRWFGKSEGCMMPQAAWKHQFKP